MTKITELEETLRDYYATYVKPLEDLIASLNQDLQDAEKEMQAQLWKGIAIGSGVTIGIGGIIGFIVWASGQ